MLDDLRKKIDAIDEKIIELISERALVAQNIAKAKHSENSPLYRPNREQEIYEKLKKLNKGPFEVVHLQNIYREIMSATIQLEGSFKAAYFGPAGSFTHQAAIKKFGNSLTLIPVNDIDEVFDVVQKKEAIYGIVPIENSTEGIVNQALDSLIDYNLNIYAEIRLSVEHNLLSFAEDLNQLKEVHTHRQAYGQCKKWLMRHLPQARWVETSSTSKAVADLAESKAPHIAAIGSQAASITYDVPIVYQNIADYENNFTRFIIIGRDHAQPSGKDRTSIIFTLPHKPGALFELLQPIMQAGVNLTSIESRPNKSEIWSYVFYIELEGHRESPQIEQAIKQISELATSSRVLGSYPFDVT